MMNWQTYLSLKALVYPKRWGGVLAVLCLLAMSTQAQLIQGPANVCHFDTNILFHTTNPGPTYNWTVNGGTVVSGLGTDSIYVNWDTVGLHRIFLTTAGMAADTDTVVVIVRGLPAPQIAGTNPTCEFLSGQAYSTPTFPGQSWQWSVNGGTFITPSNTNSVSVSWGVADTVDLIVAETNNLYGCVGYDTMEIFILPPPFVDLGVDTTICPHDLLTLDAGAYSAVLWNNGSTTPTLGVRDSGQYSVDVFDNIGCSNSDTINVSLYGSISAFISQSAPSPLCQQDTAFLSVPDTFASYAWGQGQTGDEIIVLGAGAYTVEVTDQLGCRSQDTLEVFYDPFNNPNPIITPAGAVTLCGGDSLLLDPGSGYTAYLWSNGATSQSITVNTTGDYVVQVWNGFGCMGWSETLELSAFAGPTQPVITRVGDSLVAPVSDTYQWNFNGFALPGAESQRLLPPYEGMFTVEVTDSNGCSALSDPFEYFFVSREKGNEITQIEIFPNPASKVLNVRLGQSVSKTVRCELLDPVGRVIRTRRLLAGTSMLQMDLEGISAGLYLLRLQDESYSYLKRVWVK